MREPSPVVGLTGGIASGKSTVARLLAARGVPVLDADEVARDVVAPGTEGLAEVVAAFGPQVLGPDGALDRKRLGERVFADAEARARLGAIVHPRIAVESRRRLAALAERGAPYVVYEAALLVENGAYRMFPVLVVVCAPEHARIQRIMERDGLGEAEARARLRAQLDDAEKRAVADFVVDNDGSRADLEAKVVKLDEALRARLGGGGSSDVASSERWPRVEGKS
jgi:dephospho-CoA kinase